MSGKEITLIEMLNRREARKHEQDLLLEKYHDTLISFTMNIPGPVKTNELIRQTFENGKNLLMEQLKKLHAQINHSSEIHQDTGDELLLSVKNIPPETLKTISINIENISPAARLYDIDVIDQTGRKLTRRNYRKCLICDKQAQECARTRNHTVEELQQTIINLLTEKRKDKT